MECEPAWTLPSLALGGAAADLSVAQLQLRKLARAADDAQVRVAEATEKRAETEGESLSV